MTTTTKKNINSSDDQVMISRKVPPSLPERAQLARVLFEPFSTVDDVNER